MDELDLLEKQAEDMISEENLQADEETETKSEEENIEENISEEKSDKNKSDYLPVSKYMEEKRRRRQVEEELRKLKAEKMSNEKASKIERLRGLAKDKGYDDDLADLLGSFADELLSSIPNSAGKTEEDFLVEEIRDAQEYGGLKDAMKFKDQIISRVKKNGLTIEEAYRLESAGRVKELQGEKRTQEEQIAAMKRRQAAGDKAISVSTDSAKSSTTSLTAEDRKLLEHLKRTQPNNNWTAEKFAKYKSMYT
jgi:hypothetical protein